MNLSKLKSAALAVGLLAAALAAPGAHAGVANGSLGVSAGVAANCSLTTTPVTFAPYSPIGTGTVNGTGTLVVTCVKGTNVTNIQLGAGSNGTTGTYARSMISGTDHLGYDLYIPASTTAGAACAYTTKWDSSTGVFAPGVAGSNAANTYNVCGQTTNGQNVPVGTYSDSVSVTVNF